MDYKKNIALALSKQLLPLGLTPDKITALLETPPKPDMGNVSFPCFVIARELKRSPMEIAKDLEGKMGPINGVQKVAAIGGYVNFFVDTQKQSTAVLSAILKEKKFFGRQKQPKKIRVMIEYSGPNTNKPLHIGHLRNNTLGMALSNLHENLGFDVIKANIVNDRGVHICKSMLAYQLFGTGVTPKSEMKKSDHLVGDFYVKFAQESEQNPALALQVQTMLQQWENNDPKVRALWKKMSKWALDGFKETYKRYGTEFDVWFFESEFYNKAKPILDAGLKKGVFEKREDGAIVAKLNQFGLPEKVVLRSDGTSIYITQDLALTVHKFEEYKLNEAIWVVATEQNLYFEQLFKIFELLEYPWVKNCHHVSYGLVHLPEGRMKSREGKVVDADDLLNDLEKLSEEEIQKRYPDIASVDKKKRAKAIALAAIKFFMLKFDAKKDFVFNPKESLSFEGETGPYLLYSYARAKSILRKARPKEQVYQFGLLLHPLEHALIRLLEAYPKKLSETHRQLSLHVLCHYLIGLAAAFNSFYHEVPVLSADEETKNARLGLVLATATVLSNGLELLGIHPLEKM
ncbi:MAG: arginine--tRNA ligase [Candidatus Diapherotrites archaeon]|uniref:Arginine--tRNA ligase n=1 Tax=Candidatus Iainarchaeum sp. TaxID=3101447 RepID=A0A8T4LG51_9ARCH|nr:arginine--tRNA ligase [Candidatus Diapherotrites archaeon]